MEVGDESSLDFYTRHGFVRTENDEEVGTSHVVLRGDRDAALAAIRGMAEQGSGGAVVMNLVARLLHDKGDLEGAVDAYLKAVQVSLYTQCRRGFRLVSSSLLVCEVRDEIEKLTGSVTCQRFLSGAFQQGGPWRKMSALISAEISTRPTSIEIERSG